MLRRGLLLGFLLIAVPSSAFALQTTVWDFRNAQVPGDWEVQGEPSVQPEQNGLHIVTNNTTHLMHAPVLTHPAHVVSMTFEASRDIDAFIVWQNTKGENGLAVPFFIPAGQQTVDLNMIDYETWSTSPQFLGFQLSANVDVRLVDIQVTSWSLGEQLGEMWKSFWKFDQLLPYSINFLWGPVLTRTPVGTQALFTTLPPQGWSLNRVMLPALALAGLPLIVLWFAGFKRRSFFLELRWHWGIFLLLFGGAWILFDARMGLELLSYVQHDYQHYILAPPENGTLRNYEAIYYGVLANMDTLQQEPTYVFHAPPGTPFRSLARYLTYPNLPIEQQNLTNDVRNWFVFERDDIEMGPANQLLFNGRPLTPPGDIVTRFGKHSLLFRTSAPTQ